MAGRFPNEEYEAQYLGFSPSMLVAGVEQIIEQRVGEALDQLEEQFSKVDTEVLPEDERIRGMVKLRAATDKNFAQCSYMLKKTLLDALKVPAHLLHPADLEQATPATKQEVEALSQELDDLRQELLNELDDLRQELLNARYMRAQCQAQLKTIEKAIEEQDKVLSGVLSPASMAKIKEAKERLSLIRDNQDDLIQATLKAKEATKDVSTASCSSPSVLAGQESLVIASRDTTT